MRAEKRKSGAWFYVSAAIIIVGALGVVIYTAYTQRPVTSSSGKVQVVAAENFWGNIAAQIGGQYADVTSIISDPSADPHLYESDARDATAIGQAQLVIENGLGYDDFMDKLLAVSSKSDRRVISAATVLNITSANANPHLWYDTARVKTVAINIEQQLVMADPAHKAEYTQNLATFNTSLEPIFDTIATIEQKYPNAPVAYTERVPGYLLENAGLEVKTPTGFAAAIEEGNDPSPADSAAMDSLITSHKVKVLLYNSQATSKVTEHVQDLAKAAGISVVGVTETLPASEPTFQSWQLDQDKALLAALGG